MDIISILGLVLGLAVLIMMGFKGWGMIPTSIVGALVVVITNRMDLWEALSTHYGTFMKNYAGDYFLMFFLGTLFGALMGSSGAAKSIACKIVDLMGSKRALLIVVITSAVLSYGGVSFAVVVFTLYPIALVLFKIHQPDKYIADHNDQHQVGYAEPGVLVAEPVQPALNCTQVKLPPVGRNVRPVVTYKVVYQTAGKNSRINCKHFAAVISAACGFFPSWPG